MSDTEAATTRAGRSVAAGLMGRTLGGFAWAFSGTGVQGILHVAVIAVLARILLPAEFGTVGASLVVIGIVSVVAEIGVGAAVVQRDKLTSSLLRTAFTLCVLLSLVFTVTFWVAAPSVAQLLRIPEVAPVLRALTPMFMLSGVAIVAESLLLRDLRFRQLAFISAASYGLGYGAVAMTLAFAGWGVWSLVAGHLMKTACHSALVLAVQRGTTRFGFDGQALRDLLRFGVGMTFTRLFNSMATQGDNVVVARWLGADALGIYGRAYQLLIVPVTFLGSVMQRVAFPALASVRTDPERLQNGFRSAVSSIASAAIPMSVILFWYADVVVDLLLGPRWEAVVVPLRILATGMLFRTGYKLSDSLVRAAGQVYRSAGRQLLYATLVITGAWVGQFWGAPGVAAGVVVAVSFHFFSMAQLSNSIADLRWSEWFRIQIPGVALGAVAGVVVGAVSVAAMILGGVPRVLEAGIGVGTAAAATILAVVAWPRVFVGPDGERVLRVARGAIAGYRARRAGGRPPLVDAGQDPA
jgi:O-antigen/teichoic acid export membrane protein